MHKSRVIFRADGNAEIGLGHIYRCLALADMLKDEFECHFFVQQPLDSLKLKIRNEGFVLTELPLKNIEEEYWQNSIKQGEIVVLDGYHFTINYQKALKLKKCNLVYIDDLADQKFVADVIINHNPVVQNEYITALYTRIYQGVNYALVNPVFFKYRNGKQEERIKSVFICFGGSDSKNITFKAVDACLNLGIENIQVVTGSAYEYLNDFLARYQNKDQIIHKHAVDPKEIATLISKADLAICPSSTISYEVATIGTGLLTGYYADNQKNIERFLVSEKCALSVGDFNEADSGKITDYIREVEKVIGFQISNQRKIFTDSKTNLIKIFRKLDKANSLSIREAEKKDVNLYFTWANDSEVRHNAINQEAIDYKDHVQWFENKINNPESYLYVAEISNSPIGQVRYDAIKDGLEIDYFIAKEYRGLGLADLILSSSIKKLSHYNKKGICLKATVLEENISSLKTFFRLGFKNISNEIINKRKYIKLSKCNQLI